MSDVLRLKVRAIISETFDTKTIVLESPTQENIAYESGQFLTLIIQHDGHEVRRSYSLSTAPGIDAFPAITVKRVTNGNISRYLLDHLTIGDELVSLPPAGRFTIDIQKEVQRDIFLIGGGSGITPLFSILQTVLHQEPQSRITLIYVNRSPTATIFLHQLTGLAKTYPEQLNIIHLWSSEGRRLNNTSVEALVRKNLIFEAKNACFYLCGPTDLMRMAQFTLKFMGFDGEQIRKENFVIDIPPPPLTSKLDKSATLTLHFKGQTHNLKVEPWQNILQAALNQGIPLPYSCRGGRCATCMGHCTAGQVYMSINDVLTERDIANGLILTCTAYPETEAMEVWVGK